MRVMLTSLAGRIARKSAFYKKDEVTTKQEHLRGKLHFAFLSHRGGPAVLSRYYRKGSDIRHSYCILITPRSGSTWLTRKIAAAGGLSYPDEYFIADEMESNLSARGAVNIFDYYDGIAPEKKVSPGIFGFEISYFDLLEVEREARLTELMHGQQHFFYLRRENLIAQAVSLFMATESGIFHSFGSERPPPQAVTYDNNKLLAWAGHITQQEEGIERWLAENSIRATRVTYERMVEGIDHVIDMIASTLCAKRGGGDEVPQTNKIATNLNSEFERRFRAENPEFLHEQAQTRAANGLPS